MTALVFNLGWSTPVGEISARNFGLFIAYLVPGFLVLIGLACVSDGVGLWLNGVGSSGPSVGSFLFVVVASTAAGMTVSAFRWLILDKAHELTGLARPPLEERMLYQRLEAFDYIVENHYRYYQFYGNSAIALVVAYAAWVTGGRPGDPGFPLAELWVGVIVAVFVAGSRDTLRKYYSRAERLLGSIVESEVLHRDERQSPEA